MPRPTTPPPGDGQDVKLHPEDEQAVALLAQQAEEADGALPEEEQAVELRRVADLGRRRAALLAQAELLVPPLREAALDAVRAGAQRKRVTVLGRIGPNTLTAWLRAAGIKVREKRAG